MNRLTEMVPFRVGSNFFILSLNVALCYNIDLEHKLVDVSSKNVVASNLGKLITKGHMTKNLTSFVNPFEERT